jgi:peptidoglycan/xylan/chitin deacetylase (PgdA/CDA1 family)
MIDVLQRHHAKATFFVIGRNVVKYPNLVRMEIAAGESVGGHTWTHPHLRTLTRAAITTQLASTRDLIRSLGAPARCFRPPFGETNATVESVAQSVHVHQYLWTTESKDWTGAAASVDLAKALAGLQPGAIIVFHDWVPQTQQVVDQFLTVATRRGYVAAALPC